MNIRRFILFLILVAVLGGIAFAQENMDRETLRWLRKKPIIESIDIEGNHYFDDNKIKQLIFSRVSNFWRALKKDRARRVQRETILRDTSEVKYLYLSNGFLGVKVDERFDINPSNEKAHVIISIKEGNQYLYGDVTFDGNFPSRFIPRFQDNIEKLKKRKPVNPFQLQQVSYDIKSVLANNGYPYARATYIVDTQDSLAKVMFRIESDSLVHYGNINITGAHKYDQSLAERELTFKKGDIYRRKDLIDSQTRLFGTGYYLTLRLESEQSDTLDMVKRLNPDFLLNLREKNAQFVSIKTGAEQDTTKDLIWSIGTSWGKRNFLRSRTLELSARGSFEVFTDWRFLEHTYKLSITEPWFLGIKMPLTLSGQIDPAVKSPIQAYRKWAWSVSATSLRKIGDKWKLLFGVQYEKLKIFDIDTTQYADVEAIKADEGISVRRKIYFNTVRDSRNSIFVPTRGSYATMNIDYIGGFLGGDDSFYKFEASWSRYQKVWPGWISASRIKSGYAQEMRESMPVPIDDRFYIGGANTIRGFNEKNLGPKDDSGKVIGANIYIIINQEFRYPIISKFWGSFFIDMGNGFADVKEIEIENLAISYGLGIQYISPAGPIRLDYARRVGSHSIRRGSKFHFTILYAF